MHNVTKWILSISLSLWSFNFSLILHFIAHARSRLLTHSIRICLSQKPRKYENKPTPNHLNIYRYHRSNASKDNRSNCNSSNAEKSAHTGNLTPRHSSMHWNTHNRKRDKTQIYRIFLFHCSNIFAHRQLTLAPKRD